MYKLLMKARDVVECGVIEDQADAERWVRTRVAAAGARDRAGGGAAARRARRRRRQVRLRGEVDRLLLYALGQKTITAEDARQVAGPAALQDRWAITNAIEAGAAPAALQQLALVFDAGAPPEKCSGSLAGWCGRSSRPAAIGRRASRPCSGPIWRSSAVGRSSDQPRMLLERLVVELCGKAAATPLTSPTGAA